LNPLDATQDFNLWLHQIGQPPSAPAADAAALPSLGAPWKDQREMPPPPEPSSGSGGRSLPPPPPPPPARRRTGVVKEEPVEPTEALSNAEPNKPQECKTEPNEHEPCKEECKEEDEAWEEEEMQEAAPQRIRRRGGTRQSEFAAMYGRKNDPRQNGKKGKAKGKDKGKGSHKGKA
jgi:hypothetical protein